MSIPTGAQIVEALPIPNTGTASEYEDAPRRRLTFAKASDITPTKPEWLWESWLLRRSLNLLAGRQGSGKTTFASWVLAALTTGRPLPGMDTAPELVRAAFLSLEEPPDRIVARLYAAGADLENVLVLGDVEDFDDDGNAYRRRWSLPQDIGVLGQVIEAQQIRLVVVDGLGYAISGDSHNYAVVGSALAALSAEADRTGCAVLGLVHPPKGSSDPVTAAIGSTAWTAIPRVSMVLGNDPQDDTRRVVRVAKSNYRMPEAGLAFTIGNDDTYECGFVASITESTIRAEDITAGPVSSEERTERTEARDFLREYLADGPCSSEDAIRAAERVGISKRTLERARKDLCIVSTRANDPTTGRMIGWTIALPGQIATPPTTPPASGEWRSGRSGHKQGKQCVSAPDRQTAKAEGDGGDLDEREVQPW